MYKNQHYINYGIEEQDARVTKCMLNVKQREKEGKTNS